MAQSPVDFTELVNKPHKERALVMSFYYIRFCERIDSVILLQHVEEVRELAHKHADDQLLLETDLMLAHCYRHNNGKVGYEGLLRRIQPLIERAKTISHSGWFIAQMHRILGVAATNFKRYESAFMHLSKTVEILKDKPEEAYPYKNITSFYLGYLHYAFHEYEETSRIFNHILRHPASHDRPYHTKMLMNTLGLMYRDVGNLDSSDFWFQHIYELAVERDDSLYIKLSQGNLGENHYLRGDFEKASDGTHVQRTCFSTERVLQLIEVVVEHSICNGI